MSRRSFSLPRPVGTPAAYAPHGRKAWRRPRSGHYIDDVLIKEVFEHRLSGRAKLGS